MRNRRLLFAAAIGFIVTAAFAQTKDTKEKKPVGKQVMEMALGKASNYNGGAIPKREFDVISTQGIRIKNSQGAFVEGFSFTYGERNVYEDSAGVERLVTEYLTEYCMGDTLSPIINATMRERSKPGDTAYYDDIHIRMPDGKSATGKSMKFVITR